MGLKMDPFSLKRSAVQRKRVKLANDNVVLWCAIQCLWKGDVDWFSNLSCNPSALKECTGVLRQIWRA